MSMNCFHLRLYIDDVLSPTGGITVATRLEDGVCYLGASYCSPLDQFIRRDGIVRATGRTHSKSALRNWRSCNCGNPEESRDVWDDIWDEFRPDLVDNLDILMGGRWGKALIWMFLDAPGAHNVRIQGKDGSVLWENDFLVGVWGDVDSNLDE